MKYSINPMELCSIFALPSSVADDHIKLASEYQLKVLLLFIKNQADKDVVSLIQKRLNLSIGEVEECLDYWVLRGVLLCEGKQSAKEQEVKKTPIVKDIAIEKPTRNETTNRIASCEELNYLSKVADQYGFTMKKISTKEIEELAIGNSHGGILAKCSPRTIPCLDDNVFENIVKNGFYVMLDGIEDPYNFGYSLRSIYAAGADGIILTPRNWLTAAGVVARASAGSSELIPLYISEPTNAVDFFKKSGYKVVCADKPNSVSIYDADLKKPIFLIVGGEKRGIRASVLEKADEIVRIDYGRDFNASLSAASASTVIAYEILRQNR